MRNLLYLGSNVYDGFDKKIDFSYFRRLLSKIYENKSKIFPLVIFISFILEIFILHNLYYFYYISFFVLIIKYIGDFIWIIGRRLLFFREVCLSDYIHKNYTNPRYKYKFWISMLNKKAFFGFVHEYITPKEFDLSKTKGQEYFDSLELYNIKIKTYLNGYNHFVKLRKRVVENKTYSIGMRIKCDYMDYHSVRINE